MSITVAENKLDTKAFFGTQLSEKLEAAFQYIWKLGEVGAENGINRLIKLQGNYMHIILPIDEIFYQDGKIKTIDRTKYQDPSMFTKQQGTRVTDSGLIKSFFLTFNSNFTTKSGKTVLVEVVKYNRQQRNPANSLYEYQKTDFTLSQESLSFVITRAQAACYYFFLFSHWNADSEIFGGIINAPNGAPRGRREFGLFKESNPEAAQTRSDNEFEQVIKASSYYLDIKEDMEKINAVAEKLIFLIPTVIKKELLWEKLVESANKVSKLQAIKHIASTSNLAQHLLAVQQELGDFTEPKLADIKERVATGLDLGVLYWDIPKGAVCLNDNPALGQESNFASKFVEFPLRENDFVFWKSEDGAMKSEVFSQHFLDMKDEPVYRKLWEVIETEKTIYRDGQSPNRVPFGGLNSYIAAHSIFSKRRKQK